MPSGLSNVVATAGGRTYSLGLKSDGTVVAWGYTDDYPGLSGLSNVAALACGEDHLLALKSDGTVTALGSDQFGQTDVPSGLTNAVAIACGAYYSLALRSDGTVTAWGYDADGETNVPTGLTNAVSIACGFWHSLALVPATTVVVTSPRGAPAPGIGTNWVIRDALLTCRADADVRGTTQYVCTGWSGGGGSIPANGASNAITITITNNSKIKWLWAKTNYWLDLLASPHGTVSPTSGWYALKTNLQVCATPDAYYHFTGWTGSVNSATNPFTTNVTGPGAVTARFAANLATNATPQWWLAQYGWTNNFDAAAMSDPDHDGMATWQEYLADTIPTDPASVLRITNIVWEGGPALVEWTGGTQAWQILEVRTNLTGIGSAWLVVWSNPPPNMTATNFMDLSSTNGVRFYRLRSGR